MPSAGRFSLRLLSGLLVFDDESAERLLTPGK